MFAAFLKEIQLRRKSRWQPGPKMPEALITLGAWIQIALLLIFN